MTERKVHQPIHPDVLPKLLPEYVAHHNEHSVHTPPVHELPWDPAIRKNPPVQGGSEPLKVGDVKDIPLSKCTMRVFTPESAAPAEGWPVFVFFHGGGWTLGNINTENAFSTNMCNQNPYPAAVEDAVEALRWVHHNGRAELNANLDKLAVGGSSSGGNLAAILTHKAALSEPSIPLLFQLLVVPVVDNTASLSGKPYASWRENANTVSLVPEKMLWFRRNYSPNETDWSKWDNSPIFAPDDTFKKAPNAWIAVAELDILRDEGIAYGEKLKAAGAEVEVKIYKGAPHPIMAMDGKLSSTA
ncbi:hypothetical protein A0H81_01069 [Grifola frondosa]|uniref:Alpha/beta hydrolase fold-3 domain-containing protein n=1 Tax=Grifola frondosa TaxID=5627 RepID=A0A1C7MQK1_GRIFR|nr:hypothetical protein A0H81_01069 [Grifola frondosa]